MKFKTVALAILLLSLPAWCAPNAGAAFDSLKGLTGQWQEKDPSGKMQTITWQLISGGSVLMESMKKRAW